MKPVSLVSIVLGTLLGPVPAAEAGPLADALQRHSEQDVHALRAQRGDLAARCTLGAVYAKRNDLSRAALYLAGCDEATLPEEVSASIARIDREIKRQLRDTDLARIEVVTYPETMVAEIDALPGETFTTPATVYVKPGKHTVSATQNGLVLTGTVTAAKHGRAVAILGDPHVKPAGPPKTGTINMDEGAETQTQGPPPPVKRGSLIGGKYDKGLKAVATADDPNGLQDPLAVREPPRAARPYWLGFRLGGGMFDDGATAARPGMVFAATGRLTLANHTFVAGRFDWSRRGGDAPSSVDVIGASAGIGRTVLGSERRGLAVLAQLRGDLRLADERMTIPVSRAGLTAAAGVELALPSTPFTAGVRFEQGLTTLVPGARDRAILLELGVDWR